MKKIKKLSNNLISKIAAGQVIESPCDVIKELIENSIDADATEIEIELINYGFEEIKVIDNGCGIEKEDLSECIKRYTTSKISKEEDLFQINSFGFRGEALSSILASSNLEIVSKVNNKTAFKIYFENEKEIIKPIGAKNGTIVKCSSLFEKIPARKNFLKSKNIEIKKIIKTINSFAIIYPEIRFSLKNNNKQIFIYKKESKENRIKEIFSKNFWQEKFIVKIKNSHFEIKGFFCHPKEASKINNNYIYVNNRNVKNINIEKEVKKAYGSLIDPRTYPQFILEIKISNDLIDVNVHPKKEKINFLVNNIEKIIYENVLKEIKKNKFDFHSQIKKDGYLIPVSKTIKNKTKIWDPRNLDVSEIIQINKTYLLTQINKEIYIFDQHAAHERILYEDFKKVFYKNINIKVKTNIILKINSEEYFLIKENINNLSKIGFKFNLKNNFLEILQMPKIFLDVNNHILKNIILDYTTENDIDAKSEKTLSYLSCRSAIKAGDFLNIAARKKLLKKLFTYDLSAYTCPHGRPVLIKIDILDLEKNFKRK